MNGRTDLYCERCEQKRRENRREGEIYVLQGKLKERLLRETGPIKGKA
jgi:hypothetical protein